MQFRNFDAAEFPVYVQNWNAFQYCVSSYAVDETGNLETEAVGSESLSKQRNYL